ncbi:hypothetical protein [Terriglobus sp. RCC_193]|uniref:hypothetical protein n=1 Tax=Terriglobus sp. RCC_193 TaxID=3239218 RepID=UPI0035250D4D
MHSLLYRMFAAVFAGSLFACSCHAQGTDDRIYAQPPLQTELITPLDAGRLKPGALVAAKVSYNWKIPNCTLDSGSTVTGHILAAQVDKGTRTSTIAIQFDAADCNGKLQSPVRMRVFALIFMPSPTDERAFADRGGLFGSFSPRPPQTSGGGAGLASAGVQPESVVHRYDVQNDMTIRAGPQQKLPSVIRAGMVFGEKKVTLDPDGGPENSSLVRKQETSFRIAAGTRIILMPKLEAQPLLEASVPAKSEPTVERKPTEATAIASTLLPSTALSVRPKDETEVCSSDCSAETVRMTAVSATGEIMDLAKLGYSRPDRRELDGFHHAYTLTYLDAGHLLLTFDLHDMRIRRSGGLHPDYVHTVRAIIINPATRNVIRVVDWKVIGEEQYVWPASAGHVLVHLGHQLRLLDTNLATVQTFDLDGPLLWVAVAPAGSVFAAGTLKERHSDDLHHRLTEIAGYEPEETVRVQFLDAEFRSMGETSQPSTVGLPVLTPKGELRVLSLDLHRWQIEEFDWDHARHTIATTVSDCQPRVSLPTEGTVFVAGCDRGQVWYRVLRQDGHTVVRGDASSRQLELAAAGDSSSDAFAVRVVWNAISHDRAARIRAVDLRGEQVAVYRAADGRRLLISRVEDVPLTEQSFALAPNAHQLAVLGTHGVYFFPIEQAKAN